MASPLLIKSQGFQEGYSVIATPQKTPLRWITVGRLGLRQKASYENETGAQEAVIALISGAVTLEGDGFAPQSTEARADMFGGGPFYLCLPPGTAYRLTATTHTADMMIFHAPTDTGAGVHLVRPDDVPSRVVGASNWTRTVWPGTSMGNYTRRLLVGETINPPGNWSSYPPHKHDTDNPPIEAVYEEVYCFSIKPANGFGLQRIYERHAGEPEGPVPDALNECFAVEDGDVFIIPRGYHPVVAAPGYQLGYIWALCGQGHAYGAWSDDPDHAWLRNVEPILERH
jgi:5-deoxy-glucuronate isomerase